APSGAYIPRASGVEAIDKGGRMPRRIWLARTLAAVYVAALVFSGGASVTSAAEDDVVLFPKVIGDPDENGAPPSGMMDFRDRDGIAYYNDPHCMRENDESGIFVARSTNGGFTWSRPCVPAGSTDATARCGGNGDVRRPGDGVVNYYPDNDNALNGSVPANDK